MTATILAEVGQDHSLLERLNEFAVKSGDPLIITVGASLVPARPGAPSRSCRRLRTAFCSSELWQVPGYWYERRRHRPFDTTAEYSRPELPFLSEPAPDSSGIYVILGVATKGADDRALLDVRAASFLPVPDFCPEAYEHEGGCSEALRFHIDRNYRRLRSRARLHRRDTLEQLGEIIRADGRVLMPAHQSMTVASQRLDLQGRRTGKLFFRTAH